MNSIPVLVITGGIGAGKSYVSRIFERKGIPVYDSDSRTKALYDTDEALLASLCSIIGSDIVNEGVLDKALMASRIFSDKSLLEEVESVVFPSVIRDFMFWKSAFEGKVPFVIMESAIFLMKPILAPVADKVLYVDAPLDVRVSRVMARDSVSADAVRTRIANQADLSGKADWVIDTVVEHDFLEDRVDFIISEMIK